MSEDNEMQCFNEGKFPIMSMLAKFSFEDLRMFCRIKEWLDIEYLDGMCEVMEIGHLDLGYEKDNWKKGTNYMYRVNSAGRHLYDYSIGLDMDNDGFRNLCAVGVNCMMVDYWQAEDVGEDDRLFTTSPDGETYSVVDEDEWDLEEDALYTITDKGRERLDEIEYPLLGQDIEDSYYLHPGSAEADNPLMDKVWQERVDSHNAWPAVELQSDDDYVFDKIAECLEECDLEGILEVIEDRQDALDAIKELKEMDDSADNSNVHKKGE